MPFWCHIFPTKGNSIKKKFDHLHQKEKCELQIKLKFVCFSLLQHLLGDLLTYKLMGKFPTMLLNFPIS